MTIDRGVVRFGPGETGEIDRPGLWLRGTLKAVDFDDWLTVSRGQGNGSAKDTNLPIAGADVKIGELDFFNRRFNELAVNAVNAVVKVPSSARLPSMNRSR